MNYINGRQKEIIMSKLKYHYIYIFCPAVVSNSGLLVWWADLQDLTKVTMLI